MSFLVPFARVPFWMPSFDPLPFETHPPKKACRWFGFEGSRFQLEGALRNPISGISREPELSPGIHHSLAQRTWKKRLTFWDLLKMDQNGKTKRSKSRLWASEIIIPFGPWRPKRLGWPSSGVSPPAYPHKWQSSASSPWPPDRAKSTKSTSQPLWFEMGNVGKCGKCTIWEYFNTV